MDGGRREFLKCAATVAAGLAVGVDGAAGEAAAGRKFTICLSCGPIGVPDDPAKAIERATRYGYEAIEPSLSHLGKLSDAELHDYLGKMHAANLVWGAGGLPVNFKTDDEATFERDLAALPDRAKVLQRAGVTRVATWLSPNHPSLTYVANFRLHAKRLRATAKILSDHGLRLGLEYVAPKTSWTARRFPFIHTMAEMKDLLAEIGAANVGFLLDTWHWYTAGESEHEVAQLRNQDVVLCHVNDAPNGIPVDQQRDNHRALPCSTGVINLEGFFTALRHIGYDGPLVCEPFSDDLRGQPADEVLATVAAAMKRAVALPG